ncbi:MAG: hypothetical protein NTZ97_01445 [Candidatus Moranbacteria bacterium]|nr:hypothetical protein [Candidatus Moranbacteria bacterium]
MKKFIETAIRMGVQVNLVSEKFKIIKFFDGKKEKLLYKEQLYLNRRPGTLFTKNKEITKILLKDIEINVPEGIFAKDLDEALELMKINKIDYPVVAKPIDAAKGLGVTVGIKNATELKIAINKIKEATKNTYMQCSGEFLVEKMKKGNDFRVLVLNSKAIACAQRVPAHIIGDGEKSIYALISTFNKTRPKSYSIIIDKELKTILKIKNLTLDSILKKDFYLQLRENANISAGGRAIDKTTVISERFKKIAVLAADKLDLNYTGVDIMTEDITSNDPDQEYNVIELNGAPDYDIHEKPVIDGAGTNVTELLIKEFMK